MIKQDELLPFNHFDKSISHPLLTSRFFSVAMRRLHHPAQTKYFDVPVNKMQVQTRNRAFNCHFNNIGLSFRPMPATQLFCTEYYLIPL